VPKPKLAGGQCLIIIGTEGIARTDAEARLAQFREDLERFSQEAEVRFTAAQIAREQAEAEAAQLRQENQARRDRGLLARLRAALRRE
jgi:hypothetical protein